MEFFDFLYRNGLWISIPILVGGLTLLGSSIKSVIRLRVEKQILSVPVVEQQQVEFGESGRVVLCVEGPLFTRRFANTGFELRRDDGTPVRGRTTWFHARSSSFTRVRMEMRLFDLPMPGRYELRMPGIGKPQPGDDKHRVVFMIPHLAQTLFHIIGILLGSTLFIGSLVLFLLRWLGVSQM